MNNSVDISNSLYILEKELKECDFNDFCYLDSYKTRPSHQHTFILNDNAFKNVCQYSEYHFDLYNFLVDVRYIKSTNPNYSSSI